MRRGALARPRRQGYRFQREDLESFAFAGLWEFASLGDKEILSAAIIVGDLNPLVTAVHDRMPVILDPDDYDRWLDPATEIRSLLRLFPAERMRAEAVSRAVSSVKNDTEECIASIGEPPLTPGGR